MAKYKEIVSMVLDMLKVTSDDATFTEEHIIFLAGRYRSFLLKQRYANDLKKQIPESNYQTICLDLYKMSGETCVEGAYLRSTKEIPALLPAGTIRVYPTGINFSSNVEFTSADRIRYVGNNKWLQNIIYAARGNDNHLLMKSQNPQFLYLKKATLRGIFENAEETSDLECDNQGNTELCDILDRDFPLEDALIAPLIELVSKELSPSIAAPEDKSNDANDNLAQPIK